MPQVLTISSRQNRVVTDWIVHNVESMSGIECCKLSQYLVVKTEL